MFSEAEKAKKHLIDAAGTMSHDIGFGRITGQVMASIYFRKNPSSLDDIEKDLHLSKAAVSIATRSLEKIGAIRQVWLKGDRKTYYQASNHLAATLQKGFLELFRKKLDITDEILKEAEGLLDGNTDGEDKKFIMSQIARAKNIHDKVAGIINNPLLKLLGI
jgi:DNA-binding transcriptional regulator GbsR (MarR family)